MGGVLALALTGCPKSIPPAPAWDSGAGDGGGLDYTDSDGDGACDRTELTRGTDPSRVDTDGDTFPDGVELRLGFDATRTDSPDRTLIVDLTEASLASSEMPIAVTVRGEGETFTGAFQVLPVADPWAEDAITFYAGSIAFGANPMANVFEVQTDAERFVRVLGRTQLVYVVRFAVTTGHETRGCQRVYPWRYIVKRDDGTTVFSRRYLLRVVPDGLRPESAPWCAPTGLCI